MQGFAQAIFEIGEGGLTGDKTIANACIDPVVLPLNGIAQHLNECFHIGILLDVAEQFDQEQADRVVGEADETVPVGYDGADKEKSIKEETNLERPPTMRPSGRILMRL